MKPPIEFIVYGEPKAQARPRAFARKVGGKFFARVYDAGTAEHWKSEIATCARPFIPEKLLTGPVRVDLGIKLDRQILTNGGRERPTALHISLGQAF